MNVSTDPTNTASTGDPRTALAAEPIAKTGSADRTARRAVWWRIRHTARRAEPARQPGTPTGVFGADRRDRAVDVLDGFRQHVDGPARSTSRATRGRGAAAARSTKHPARQRISGPQPRRGASGDRSRVHVRGPRAPSAAHPTTTPRGDLHTPSAGPLGPPAAHAAAATRRRGHRRAHARATAAQRRRPMMPIATSAAERACGAALSQHQDRSAFALHFSHGIGQRRRRANRRSAGAKSSNVDRRSSSSSTSRETTAAPHRRASPITAAASG